MVAYSFVQRLNPTAALLCAGVLGVLSALLVSLLPGAAVETAVLASGIPAFVPAAEPPLGVTARICLAVVAGGGTALLAWFALSLLIDFAASRRATTGPSVRRADAHPDAPPREPLRAGRDLGFDSPEAAELELEPFHDDELDLPAEPVIAMGAPIPASAPAPHLLRADPPPPPSVQPLPADLDQPLSAFDPGALPELPRVPPQLVPALHSIPPRPPVFAEGERFETFDLTPVVQPAPITAPETEATVHSLLDRLERGIARRTQPAEPTPPPAQAPGLESTLETLRRMAVRA